METKDRKSASAADHLANERTFLAWVRTSIALMGFGFVIVKFAIFVHQIASALGETNTPQGKSYCYHWRNDGSFRSSHNNVGVHSLSQY